MQFGFQDPLFIKKVEKKIYSVFFLVDVGKKKQNLAKIINFKPF